MSFRSLTEVEERLGFLDALLTTGASTSLKVQVPKSYILWPQKTYIGTHVYLLIGYMESWGFGPDKRRHAFRLEHRLLVLHRPRGSDS